VQVDIEFDEYESWNQEVFQHLENEIAILIDGEPVWIPLEAIKSIRPTDECVQATRCESFLF
jgi:hypothetical protein